MAEYGEFRKRLIRAFLGTEQEPQYFRALFLSENSKNDTHPIDDSALDALEGFVKELKDLNGKHMPIRGHRDYSLSYKFSNYGPSIFLHDNRHMDGVIGVLVFRVGFPVIIETVQGSGTEFSALSRIKKLNMEFYQKTREHFYNALIDELIGRLASNFRKVKLPTNKPPEILAFSPFAFGKMDEKMARAIITRYFKRSLAAKYASNWRLIPKPIGDLVAAHTEEKSGMARHLNVRNSFFRLRH